MVLEVGDPAPADELRDDSGAPARFSDYGGKGLVIFFYPKAMTPGCTIEACGFRDDYQQFLDGGFDIVGVSPDRAIGQCRASGSGTRCRFDCCPIRTTPSPSSWEPGGRR